MIVLATRSAGKLRELRPLFAAQGLSVIDLDEAGVAERPEEDALEVFTTFEENALAKARYFHRLTGRPAAADDSGISVSALHGHPGVLSKRWSARPDLSGPALDDENNRVLLASLEGHGDRSAHYVCAAAYVDGTHELVYRGEVHGRVTETAKGTGGFGYDPYFFATELGRTFGEATAAEKAGVSHRARAFGALLARVSAVVGK
jgi:XTP/dITP diphosphohydrolase